MKLIYSLLSLIFAIRRNNAHLNSRKCKVKFDLNICLNGTELTSNVCNYDDDLCTRRVNLFYLKIEPYGIEIIHDTLRTCCGGCVNFTDTVYLKRISEIADASVSEAEFIFPVLANYYTDMLFGYHFLPIVEAPNVYYITQKSDNKLRKLIYSCIDMWPMVLIFLLLIIVSGFICWFIETWYNEEEFPRPLFIGWFEGIWWSFISMSTVGYGDKIPKSVPARLFSIAWIFIGITIFSLVTAMLSSEIIEANSVPTPKMGGAKIASIRDRLYDAKLVAESGGALIEVNSNGDASEGIHQMVHMLNTKQIDGFVLDKYTILLFYNKFKNSSKYKHDIAYLKTKTIHTELQSREQFAYGVLVQKDSDYIFLADFVKDNRVVINTCNSLLINSLHRDERIETERNPLFSTSGDIFWTSFLTIIILIVFMFIVGVFYETWRKQQPPERKSSDCGKLNAPKFV